MIYSLFGTFCAGFLITDDYDILGLVAVNHERSDPVFTADKQLIKLNKLFGVDLLVESFPINETMRPIPVAVYGSLQATTGASPGVLVADLLHLNVRGNRLSVLYSEVRDPVEPCEDYLGRVYGDHEAKTIGFRRDQYGLIEIVWYHGHVFGLRRNDLLRESPRVAELGTPAAIAG